MGKRSQMAIGHERPTGRKIDQVKLAMTKGSTSKKYFGNYY